GQREAMSVRRGELLHTDAAAERLEERCPERYAELRDAVGEPELVRACRLVALHHLDRCWVQHLEFLTDLRDGIHLRALGRESPLDAFNKAAIEAFESGLADVDEETVRTFESLRVDGDRIDLELAGLKRPTATWTYLVKDNPFGTQADRVLAWVGTKVGRPQR
ncbi:MAG: accessory Sec system translocase SecA2, partial [Nocardioidaceae bacterium]